MVGILLRRARRQPWAGGESASIEVVVRVTNDAAAAVILDRAGGGHRLDELWAEQTVVLVFLRHFG